MPWIIRKKGDQFCVYKEGADGRPEGDSLGCHANEGAADRQRQALYANVKEFSGTFSDVIAITELRGSYPNVPIASDVDFASLTAGDSEPVFLTLPIGKINAKSGNGRFYDEAWIKELERQTLATKPIGLMGHLKPDERATAFPDEAIHWVGAVMEQDTLWGKGYIPPGPVRDRIRRYKAQGKAIATSIDAFAEGVWEDGIGAYRMTAGSLRLNQIDLAPADRAGIPSLAAQPIITSEMADNQPPTQAEEFTEMDKLQLIRELTAEDARLLPKPVRDAIIGDQRAAPEVAQMAQIRETLGIDANADLATAIRELIAERENQRKNAINGKITELVNSGIRAEAMRPLITELVTARQPATVEAAQAAYDAVAASEAVKKMLGAHVQETMGPAQATPVAGQQGKAKYFAIPA